MICVKSMIKMYQLLKGDFLRGLQILRMDLKRMFKEIIFTKLQRCLLFRLKSTLQYRISVNFQLNKFCESPQNPENLQNL